MKNIKNILKIELISFFVIVLLVTTVAVNAQTSAEVTSVEPETVPVPSVDKRRTSNHNCSYWCNNLCSSRIPRPKTKKTNACTFINSQLKKSVFPTFRLKLMILSYFWQ